MDYNYVRMRNALAAGDAETAERCRRQYENKQKKKNKESPALNIVILVLLVIATGLGVFAVLSSRADKVPQPEEAAVTEQAEEGDGAPPVVSAPDQEEGQQ